MTRDEIQTEALAAIGDSQKAGVEISMGVGKCVLGMRHMSKDYTEISSFLVVAPRTKIFDSWKDDAKKFELSFLLPHIEFTTYRSMTKYDPYEFDVIYLDECHSLKQSHLAWLKVFEQRGGKILGLTGTYPVRKGTEKGKMCNYFCPKVYEYLTDDAVGDDILNDYRIFVHKLYLDGAPTIKVPLKDGGSFMTSEVKNYDYWQSRLDAAHTPKSLQIARIQRMKAIQKMPSKERYAAKLFARQKDKSLIFANTKEQADRLCTTSIHSGVPKKEAEKRLDAFKAGEVNKVSAVDQLSEGITVPGLKVGIIMHSYSNNRKAAQKIGRFLRLNPDDMAYIHILCYMNSVDHEWVINALSGFDQSKIEWVDPI